MDCVIGQQTPGANLGRNRQPRACHDDCVKLEEHPPKGQEFQELKRPGFAGLLDDIEKEETPSCNAAG